MSNIKGMFKIFPVCNHSTLFQLQIGRNSRRSVFTFNKQNSFMWWLKTAIFLIFTFALHVSLSSFATAENITKTNEISSNTGVQSLPSTNNTANELNNAAIVSPTMCFDEFSSPTPSPLEPSESSSNDSTDEISSETGAGTVLSVDEHSNHAETTINATPMFCNPPTPPSVPNATSAPTVSVSPIIQNSAFTISVNYLSHALSYQIQQKLNSGNYTTIYSGSSRSRSISVNTTGTVKFRYRGCNGQGCGGYSPEKTVGV